MRHHQQGMSMITLVLALGLLGMLAKFAIAVVPAYLDYMTLDKTIKAMFRETQIDSQNANGVKSNLQGRFQINNIPDAAIDYLTISKDGNKTNIELNYDVRQNFVANIDVVVHFQNSYSSDKAAGVQ